MRAPAWHRIVLLLASAGAVGVAACKLEPSATQEADALPSPLPREELPTTSATIAVANFEAQLEGFESVLERSPDLEMLAQVAGMHLARAQYSSRIFDYERAAELGERAVRDFPEKGGARLLRAKTRAALHRFPEAIADLEAAERLGLAPGLTAEVRASILSARGLAAEANAILSRWTAGREDSTRLGTRAALAGELGDLRGAEAMFARAQHLLRDTSPFPLAWLYFQQGLMWQRSGDLERARVLFEAAHARLPQHAPVASHLAGVLAAMHREAEAIALLRPLARSAEDPEYEGQLAGLLETTAAEEAATLRAHADARYRALLARHPEAYADHAARFWLGAGRDPKRALEAAEKNLEVRETADAFLLALEAALAAHEDAAGCRIAARAREHADAAKHVLALAALAEERCAR